MPLINQSVCEQCSPNCGSWTSKNSTTQELSRDVNSQAHPSQNQNQARVGIRGSVVGSGTCVLGSFSGDPSAPSGLGNNFLEAVNCVTPELSVVPAHSTQQASTQCVFGE